LPRYAQHSADIAAERAQTEKAIAEFSALAERLAALAEKAVPPVVATAQTARSVISVTANHYAPSSNQG
jgi:hypothetical protein